MENNSHVLRVWLLCSLTGINSCLECLFLLLMRFYYKEAIIMAGRTDEELEGVTLLGNQGTKYLFDYTPDVLEAFENKHANRDYFVKMNFPEFTSLCPKTGQPDFATIYI